VTPTRRLEASRGGGPLPIAGRCLALGFADGLEGGLRPLHGLLGHLEGAPCDLRGLLRHPDGVRVELRKRLCHFGHAQRLCPSAPPIRSLRELGAVVL
jgi:hypothetical protein